jgi:hypothetical protein
VSRLPARVERRVARFVEQLLLGEAASLKALRPLLAAVEERIGAAEAHQRALQGELDEAMALARFGPATTVGRALALHPGAAAVLAARGLDRCEGCPVRHDERLDELARGHDIPLEQLLPELNALL